VARNTAVLAVGRTACIVETEAVVAAVGRIDALAERTAVAAGTDRRDIEGSNVVFREQERCM